MPADRPRRAPTSTEPRSQWLDVAGAPADLPGLRRRARLRHRRRRQVRLPRRGPDRPAAPGYEEREKISTAGDLDRARTTADPGLRRRPPASGRPLRRPPGRPRRRRRRDRRRRRPLGGQAAVPLQRALLRARGRGQLGRQHGGDPAGLADHAQGRATRVSVDVTYDVASASWYESMGILPLAFSAAARPRGQGPVRRRRGRAGDV